MTKDRILAIEDDEGVCRLLRHSLAREDYEVRISHDGVEGLREALIDPPDLFLLDLELPGMDGLSVCQELKQNPVTRPLPVIFLTGKGEEADVVAGLEMGADDYIVKPFSPKILNARVQAVLRRRTSVESTAATQETLRLGELEVDTSNSRISFSGREIELGPPEYRFALLLICYFTGKNLSDACPQLLGEQNPVSLIGREGMALFSENRLNRLLPVFDGLVSARIDSPILYGFYGLALMESDPERGRYFLVESERKYREANEPIGELVALSHLVFYHVIFDGNMKAAYDYLERAEILNKAFFDRLSVYSRVAVAQNLAIGRSLILNDFDGSNEYLSIAEALAEDRGLINLVILNRLVLIFEAYVKGDREAMADGLEECFRFMNHPQVSLLHKSLLRVLQIKYFSYVGDYPAFRIYERRLQEEYKHYLDSDNLVAVQLAICRIEELQFAGRHDEALALCTETLKHPAAARSDMARPILNGHRALNAASCHDFPTMQAAIESCHEETGRATLRLALARLYCARALAHAGRTAAARETLDLIAGDVKSRGWFNLELQLRAQRLLLDPESEDVDGDTVAALMVDMQERSTWHLQSLLAEDYLALFAPACMGKPEADFARTILQKRLMIDVDEEGTPFPILQLGTLGGLKMVFGNGVVARSDEFSRTQRECLALLASVPDHRITQEEVQLTFWPDSEPDKARSTLDTMLSRLRRSLKEKLQPHPVKRYLKLQKGVLSLEGTQVDTVVVSNRISRARELARRREYWKADAAYAAALSAWQGQFMPGSCNSDQSANYAHSIQQLCLDASVEWSNILNESGQSRQSIAVLVHALAMDRCNETLMKALYRSYMRDGNIAAAHHLMQQCEEVMRSEGYGPSEIARIVATFKLADKN